MLDTGAETPVWCMTEKELLKAFPDAVKKDNTYKLKGFGVGEIDASAFVIPEIQIRKRRSLLFNKKSSGASDLSPRYWMRFFAIRYSFFKCGYINLPSWEEAS